MRLMTARHVGSGLLLLALTLTLTLTLATAALADERAGRVVAVSDGDTLTLAGPGRRPVMVRLAGIDAPEHDQPFGQRSRQSLSELALEAAAKAARVVGRRESDPAVGVAASGQAATTPEPAPAQAELAGRCGAKRTCGEMTSCAEARFYLNECGVSRLDGDKDGTPCEALCAGQ